MGNENFYEIVKNRICDEIFKGHYSDADKLPPERELEEMLEVSRVTVRKSLEILDVYKRQNPYTFERAISVLESKTIDLESLITNIVPLDDIVDVFTKPEYRRTGKVMIQFS